MPENAGIIVNSKDPKVYAEEIINLVSNKDRLLKYKEAAYKNSLKYSEEVILNKWLSFLKEYQEKLN